MSAGIRLGDNLKIYTLGYTDDITILMSHSQKEQE